LIIWSGQAGAAAQKPLLHRSGRHLW